MAPPSSPAIGGDLIFATPFEIASLDPHRANEETATIALGNIYDTLVQLDPNDSTQYIPRLAKSWDINSDSTEFTIHLREGAKFTTGNPVTADDVKFSLERLWNLQASPSFILEGMTSVTVVDPLTVTIKTAASDAPFLSKLAFSPVGIIDSKVAKDHGAVSDASAPTADTSDQYFAENSIGSGAFMLAGYTPNQELILTRNPDYWGEGPYVDRVILRDVPEPTVQKQLLEGGDIDIAFSLDYDTADSLKSNPAVNIAYTPSINIFYMFLTSKPENSEPVSKVQVHRAIQLAIDYDGIKALFGGHGTRPATTIPVGVFASDTATPVSQNLDEAMQLMADAGYPDGFSVDVTYPDLVRFNVDRKLLMTKIQSDLARIGITLNLQPAAGTVFLDNFRAGGLAMGVGDWSPDYVDPDDWTGPFWSSKVNFLTKRTGYNNPQVDALHAQSVATSDPAKRLEIYKQLQALFLQDPSLFTVFQPDFVLASSSRISGYNLIYELRQVDFSRIKKQ